MVCFGFLGFLGGGGCLFVGVLFVCFLKGKLLAMQFSRILRKGSSRHTTQTLLCKSKGFPVLTPRPNNHHAKGEGDAHSSDSLLFVYEKGYGHFISSPCTALSSGQAGTHRWHTGQRLVGRMPTAMPLVPPICLLTDRAGAVAKVSLFARGRGGQAVSSSTGHPPGQNPHAPGLTPPGLHCRPRGPAGDE